MSRRLSACSCDPSACLRRQHFHRRPANRNIEDHLEQVPLAVGERGPGGMGLVITSPPLAPLPSAGMSALYLRGIPPLVT